MRTLLRGAHVITMSSGRPIAERIDILVQDDRIAALGTDIDAAGLDVIDAAGCIVIPGLVNAHMHTWQTALRGVSLDWTFLQYVQQMHMGLATHFSADDIRVGTLAGALNQIACGTTTLGDWCHNNPTPEHTDAAIEALRESGIRAVFLHGTPRSQAGPGTDTPHPRQEIERLIRGPLASRDGLVTLGIAVSGPHYAPAEVALADFRLAESFGLVISMHHSGGPARSADGWERIERDKLLGPRVNIVHGNRIDDELLKRMLDAGVSFTVTPEIELADGHGHPITGRLRALGAAPSLGVDIESGTSGEMLTVARMALAHQRALDHADLRARGIPFAMAATIGGSEALRWATLEGAKALGLEDKVGSIEIGKQADLVMINTRALNLQPVHDPVATTLQASLANIEAVMIAGKWRKRGGELVHPEAGRVMAALARSGQRIATAAGLTSVSSGQVQ